MPNLTRLLRGLAIAAALLATATAQGPDGADLGRRLARWYRLWDAGKIQLEGTIDEPRAAERIYGEGTLPMRSPQPIRHRDALLLLIRRASGHPCTAVTEALLDLAAVGLEVRPVEDERGAPTVRAFAHQALGASDAPASIDALVRAIDSDRRGLGVRVAALRALGLVGRPVVRVFLERALADPERLVRLAAAEALAVRAHPASVDELADQLAIEMDAVVGQALVLAIHTAVRKNGAAIDAATTRRATAIAIDRLGRLDWRCDLVVVDLLYDLRTALAIEPLIGVLARFADRRGGSADSAMLRDRAHRTLESLTGTRRAADDVAGWRAFWASERDHFVIATAPPGRDDPGRTTTEFFGIPVRGSRVVFVIDVSGSMKTPLLRTTAGTSDRDVEVGSRLSFAKRELIAAVEQLPADSRFGVVVFSSEARRWNRKLVAPEPSMRKALREMLSTLTPGGGTNLWDALDLALGVGRMTWGTVDPDAADEVFLLTDGQPSAGEITAPDAIADAVREANRYVRARIHTVSLDGDARFLERLATENGGTFVAR